MVVVAMPIRSPMAVQTPNTCHSIKSLNLFMGNRNENCSLKLVFFFNHTYYEMINFAS